jgi:hypothetical protein
MDETDERTLTYGEKAVGLTFNPGGDAKVDEVKQLYAQIIDLCNDMKVPQSDNQSLNERNRLMAIAITSAQDAQMWAVKGITWK